MKTIQQIKEEKKQAELDIRHILNRLQLATGTKVESIDFEKLQVLGQQDTIRTVEIKLQI